MNDYPVRNHTPSAFVAGNKPDTTESASASAPTLSQLLKTHTRSLHREAERSGVVRAILERTVTHNDYVLYLRNLHPVYRALERRITTWVDDEVRCALADPRLYRTRAIESDLESLAGPEWHIALPCLASAKSYANAIEAAGEEELIAHAYVRYLGDLNGGQIVRRILGETLGLGNEANAFYRFDEIVDIEGARVQFRRALDHCAATCTMARVVEHACDAFMHNIAMTGEALDVSRAGVATGHSKTGYSS